MGPGATVGPVDRAAGRGSLEPPAQGRRAGACSGRGASHLACDRAAAWRVLAAARDEAAVRGRAPLPPRPRRAAACPRWRCLAGRAGTARPRPCYRCTHAHAILSHTPAPRPLLCGLPIPPSQLGGRREGRGRPAAPLLTSQADRGRSRPGRRRHRRGSSCRRRLCPMRRAARCTRPAASGAAAARRGLRAVGSGPGTRCLGGCRCSWAPRSAASSASPGRGHLASRPRPLSALAGAVRGRDGHGGRCCCHCPVKAPAQRC